MNINKKKRVVSIMLCVAMLAPIASMAMPVGAQGEDAFASSSVDTQNDKGEYSICEADIIDGSGGYWEYNSDGIKSYRLKNGEMAVGFVKINGKIYYFYEYEYEDKDEDGYEYGYKKGEMAVGWAEIDGKKYYFYEDEDYKGQMAVGWVDIRDYDSWWHYSEYYFKEDGRMAVGFVEIYGNIYYFDENGQRAVGWREINGEKYYFNEYNLMAEGWTAIDGKIYYFDKAGAERGRMAVGWREINGEKYYFDKNGQTTVGLVKIDGNIYYFYEDWREGRMAVGFVEIDDERYYFTENEGPDKGVMKTGWFKDDNDLGNRWYYAKTAEDVNDKGGNIGEVVTGEWTDLNGNEYYFVEENESGRKKGELFTGWHVKGRKWYYYSEDTNNDEEHLGKMQKGWTYVMDKDLYGEDKERKSRRYYLDEKTGAMHTGWFNDKSGATYFLSTTSEIKFKEGEMVKDSFVNINGQTYYFDENGICVEDLEVFDESYWK